MKESTINTYNNVLKRAESEGINTDELNLTEIYNILTTINKATAKLILNALIWKHKNLGTEKSTLDILSKYMRLLGRKIHNEYLDNKLTTREAKTFVPWPNVVKIYQDMKSKLDETNIRLFEDFLILSFYVLQPPRRVDYATLYISTNIDLPSIDKILWTSQQNKVKYMDFYDDEIIPANPVGRNFYCYNKNGSFFSFEAYKTADRYGRQVIEISSELDKIIKQYIKVKELRVGDKLFDFSMANYKARLSNIFKQYVGHVGGASMLRHSFITYIMGTNTLKTEKDKMILGRLMGHSIQVQSIYRKNIDIPIKEINTYVYFSKLRKNKNNMSGISKEIKRLNNKERNREYYIKNKERILERQNLLKDREANIKVIFE